MNNHIRKKIYAHMAQNPHADLMTVMWDVMKVQRAHDESLLRSVRAKNAHARRKARASQPPQASAP